LNEEFIIIGKVISTQGNKGEIKVIPFTNSANRFKELNSVFIRKGNNRKILKINKLRMLHSTVKCNARSGYFIRCFKSKTFSWSVV